MSKMLLSATNAAMMERAATIPLRRSAGICARLLPRPAGTGRLRRGGRVRASNYDWQRAMKSNQFDIVPLCDMSEAERACHQLGLAWGAIPSAVHHAQQARNPTCSCAQHIVEVALALEEAGIDPASAFTRCPAVLSLSLSDVQRSLCFACSPVRPLGGARVPSHRSHRTYIHAWGRRVQEGMAEMSRKLRWTSSLGQHMPSVDETAAPQASHLRVVSPQDGNATREVQLPELPVEQHASEDAPPALPGKPMEEMTSKELLAFAVEHGALAEVLSVIGDT